MSPHILAFSILINQEITNVKWEGAASTSLYYVKVGQCMHYNYNNNNLVFYLYGSEHLYFLCYIGQKSQSDGRNVYYVVYIQS